MAEQGTAKSKAEDVVSEHAVILRDLPGRRGRLDFLLGLGIEEVLALADELEPTRAPHVSYNDAIETLCWVGK